MRNIPNKTHCLQRKTTFKPAFIRPIKLSPIKKIKDNRNLKNIIKKIIWLICMLVCWTPDELLNCEFNSTL